MPDLKAHLIFWPVAVLGTALDLITKTFIFEWLKHKPDNMHTVIPGFFSFVMALNEGAAFGIAAGQRILLIGVSIIAVIASILFTTSCARHYNYRTLRDRYKAANYFYLQGIYALERKNASFALPNFTEAIRILPDFAEGYYQRARIYFAAGLENEAKSDFENAKKYSLEYSKLKEVEPLGFKLSDADLQIIDSVSPPEDSALLATKPHPLEKIRTPDIMTEFDEE